jgi:hypothetical protein
MWRATGHAIISSWCLPAVQLLQVPFTRPCRGGQGVGLGLGSGLGFGLGVWGLAREHVIVLPSGRGVSWKPFLQTMLQMPF